MTFLSSETGTIDLDALTEADEAWLLEHSTPVEPLPVYFSATGKADPDDYRDEDWHDWLATLDWQTIVPEGN